MKSLLFPRGCWRIIKRKDGLLFNTINRSSPLFARSPLLKGHKKWAWVRDGQFDTIPRIPEYIRSRIITLHHQGLSKAKVVETLKQEGVPVTYRRVSGVIDRYDKLGIVCDRPRSGRRKRIDVTKIIDSNLKSNDELTASDLQTIILKKTGVRVSLSAIKRERGKLGWKCTGRRTCQMIRKVNQRKRLDFAIQCVQRRKLFKM